MLGRGEFSIILARLGVAAGLDARIGPFVALYVLVLAVVSPLLASRSQLLARRIPDRLLVSNWRYVRQADDVDGVRARGRGARDVDVGPARVRKVRRERADWVHLRLCLSCGLVACCDDSRLQHASAHFAQTSHPLIASLEPGDDWRWCFVDQTLVVGPPAPAPEQRA